MSIVIHPIRVIEPDPALNARSVSLGARTLHLDGALPKAGTELVLDFQIPAARGAVRPLCRSALSGGLTFVSTLPNIEKHACIAQIVHLHEHCSAQFPAVEVHHVSSDGLEHWRELDLYHADVKALGYSLAAASPASAQSFKRAFGVGVVESHRLAHGLFALHRGRFLVAEVPENQLQSADVDRFLHKLWRVLPLTAR